MTDAILESAAEQVLAAPQEAPMVRAFFHEPTCTVSYVVHDPATHDAAVVDSVLDYEAASGRTSSASAEAIVTYVKERRLNVQWLLETHAHADHLSAAPYLQRRVGGRVATGRDILEVRGLFGKLFNLSLPPKGCEFHTLFKDGDRFRLGRLPVTVLHVPGHTSVDVAYLVGDAAFVGDTIFMPDYGTARADFPGGDARQLYRSIRRLLSLPRSTRLFLCHDYKAPGRDRYEWETTVGVQRDRNIHVRDGIREDEFVTMRVRRDATLRMPRLMLPAVQVNIRAGHLPAAEHNGVRYLKIPLDAI